MVNFWQGFEKKSGLGSAAAGVAGKLPWVKQYRAAASKPLFKAKKIVGTTALGGGALAYGSHKLTSAPNSIQQQQQQGQPA